MNEKNKKKLVVCSWNVCLGAKTKLHLIKEQLYKEKIDILCIQEAEVEIDEDEKDYAIDGYQMELENSTSKRRTLVYIDKNVNYVRKSQMEKKDAHIILLEVKTGSGILNLVAMYRTYKLTAHENHALALNEQMEIIRTFSQGDKKLLIVGDMNLDAKRKADPSYNLHRLYSAWDELENDLHLKQFVKVTTWMRIVEGRVRSSTLDHVYTNDSSLINQVKTLSVSSGDHMPVMAIMNTEYNFIPKKMKIRNWKNYTKENLEIRLGGEDWDIQWLTAQDYCDELEQKIMTVLEELIPFKEIKVRRNVFVESTGLAEMKRKRKNMFRNAQRRNSESLLTKCKLMDKKIRLMENRDRKSKVRAKMKPGDQRSLWEAVKLAQSKEDSSLPLVMNLAEKSAKTNSGKANLFAEHFQNKVQTIVEEVQISNRVYNGARKITEPADSFVNQDLVTKIMSNLKEKSSYGFDNIPMRVLKDGVNYLAKPYYILMKKICEQNKIPQQWKTSRVIPLFKKGDKTDINNYRPISNLCAGSKILEKLILQRLMDIEEKSGVNLTGERQHGFKKGFSTTTACQEILAKVSDAMDRGEYAIMASLDLTAAFDVVNVDLLLKRMEIMGIPQNLISLLKVWLKGRQAYVEVEGTCSTYFKVDSGTCQGSILGPVLFCIFIAPLLDCEDLLAYADDSYEIETGPDRQESVQRLKIRLERTIDWLKSSGLKVNEEKTELVVFYKRDTEEVSINLNGREIKSKKEIKVLGTIFDSKLEWHANVEKCVKSARKASQGLMLLRHYFTEAEKINLLTSLVYSKLYFAAQVWLIPNLKSCLKQKLYSQSGSSLKIVNCNLSYKELHKKFKRATPAIFGKYLTCINYYDVLTSQAPRIVFNNVQAVTTREERNPSLTFVAINQIKCGLNLLHNRFRSVTGIIRKNWVPLSRQVFKLKCKENVINSMLTTW